MFSYGILPQLKSVIEDVETKAVGVSVGKSTGEKDQRNLPLVSVVSVVLSVMVLMSLLACQKKEDQPSDDVPVPVVANRFKYSDSVAAPHRAALNEAVSLLYFLPLKNDDSRLMEILKVRDLSPATLQSWLEERVRYIVDGEFEVQKAAYEVTENSFTYPNMDLLPDPNQGLALDFGALSQGVQNEKDSVVMSNLGAGVYYALKKHSKEESEKAKKPVAVLVGLHIGGEVGDVVISSPRTGLLQIGNGLFPSADAFGTTQNISLGVFRASTLFHEARHSDGHGKTLAFLHANCPEGHKYAGRGACDFSSNGPYTIGTKVHKQLMDQCSQCSAAGKDILRIIFLDFSSRVIKGQVRISGHKPESYSATPADWDDAPEGSRR